MNRRDFLAMLGGIAAAAVAAPQIPPPAFLYGARMIDVPFTFAAYNRPPRGMDYEIDPPRGLPYYIYPKIKPYGPNPRPRIS